MVALLLAKESVDVVLLVKAFPVLARIYSPKTAVVSFMSVNFRRTSTLLLQTR
jgi:hypothetical protein